MNQDLVDLALLDQKTAPSNLAATPAATAEQSHRSSTTGSRTTASHSSNTANMADSKHTGPNSAGDAAAPAVCPVDHKSREAWLQQAQNATSSSSTSPHAAAAGALPPNHPRIPSGGGGSLSESREISSIPRTEDTGPSACPANHEAETGSDKASGNWIYPSEKMFFDAMRRKGHDSARTADMATIVPIHNAVNERAWKQIKEWEAPYTGTGPGQYVLCLLFFFIVFLLSPLDNKG